MTLLQTLITQRFHANFLCARITVKLCQLISDVEKAFLLDMNYVDRSHHILGGGNSGYDFCAFQIPLHRKMI